MALRDQPYIPLYIQDFLTDEKLIECSAQATGVYVRLMCIMHKSEEYGKILLKQKDKQSNEQDINFAVKLAKQMPYTIEVVLASVRELIAEKVIHIEGDFLCQKRMIKDNKLSLVRASAGSKGGKFAQAKAKPKEVPNTEIEDVNDIDNEDNNKKEFDFSKSDIQGDEIIFPLDTKPVRELWAKWKEYRWREHEQRYGMMGEQADLARLKLMDFPQMEKTILTAISNKWKNLYPDSNGKRINNNGKGATTKTDQSRATSDYLADHYRNKAKQ